MDDVRKTTGTSDFTVHTKSTSIWTPLSMTSAHHPCVHTEWPLAQIRRLRALCRNRAEADEVVEKFINSLVRANGPEIESVLRERKHPQRPNSVMTRVVIPYHPVWGRAGFWKDLHDIKLKHVDNPWHSIGLCWKLGAKHCYLRYRKFNQEKSILADQFDEANGGWSGGWRKPMHASVSSSLTRA